jgi:carbonic anhydrase
MGDADVSNREFIHDWISIVEEARDDNLEGETQLRYVERQAVKVSLKNLLSFPWVKSRVEDGSLTLHGWCFDLEAGELLAHQPNKSWKKLT